MNLSYYPGCSLEGTGREYDESARAVCRRLEIGLQELHDWNCCGANEAAAVDEQLGLQLAMRNLALAEKAGQELVVPCVGCFTRLRWARDAAAKDPALGGRAGYNGQAGLVFILDLFGRESVALRLQREIKRPLKGLKIASYYGCVLVRPPAVTGVKDYENPKSLDRMATALGAEAVDWPRKTDCCGSVMGVARKDVMKTLVGRLLDTAAEAGANAIMVACPLCHANLDARQEEIVADGLSRAKIPVFYFTELIGLALGLPEAETWWPRHLTDPRPLLDGLRREPALR